MSNSSEIQNGKMNVMGVNVDISTTLGNVICEQYLAQLSQEDMDKIIKYISSDLFEKDTIFDPESNKWVDGLKVKIPKTGNYYYDNEKLISYHIKQVFNDRIKEELKKKVEDIIATEDYQNKINEIAEELVQYSIDGYKEDMKNRIRERLIGNVLDDTPNYCGVSLQYIVNEIINNRFGQ